MIVILRTDRGGCPNAAVTQTAQTMKILLLMAD